MSDTTKTTDNVTMKRRASDWKKPLSVTKPDMFDWYAGNGVAFIDDKAMARVTAALSGARSISALLFQQEIDRNNDDDQGGLQLDEVTTCGLFNALASCIELADMHATGGRPLWTTRLTEFNTEEAEHLRKAAHNADLHKEDRQAVDRVEQINRAKAAKA